MGFDKDSQEMFDLFSSSFGSVIGLIFFPFTCVLFLLYLPIFALQLVCGIGEFILALLEALDELFS